MNFAMIATVLAGCGGSSSGTTGDAAAAQLGTVEVASLADDRLEMTIDGRTFLLDPIANANSDFGTVRYGFDSGDSTGEFLVFETDTLLVVGGGTRDGMTYYGLTGDLSMPPTGSTSYDGHFVVVNNGGFLDQGELAMTYDFGTQMLSGNGSTESSSTFSLEAIAGTDGTFSGTVEYSGTLNGEDFVENAALGGSFFGENASEVAGGFAGDAIAGHIYGAD